MIIQEILDLQPYPYQIEGDGATFLDKFGNKIGVVFEESDLVLPNRTLSVINISFGVLKSEKINIADNLDTKLTNTGDARKVFSTVGAIASETSIVKAADIIVLAGADEFKEKRAKIYMIAFLEIRNRKMPRFYKAEQVKTSNGTIALVAQSIELTEEETQFVKNNLEVHKI